MDPQTENYFKKFYQYSRNDINELLKLENNAGPLLVMVANGIDILGGMCYDFEGKKGKGNSKYRYVKFMENKMGIPHPLAELLYDNVRCGMVHQGMPKMGIEFYIQKSDGIINKEEIFCKDIEKKCLRLNVSAFAHLYIDTIDKIANDIGEHIHFDPIPKGEKEVELKNLLDCAIRCVEDKCKQDKMEPEPSSSANMPSGSSEGKSSSSPH